MKKTRPRILFICTGNAGRSQMAEAMFRSRHGADFEILSAGVEPWDALHPMAVKLMNEDGISMAGHAPKHVNTYINERMDIAVTIGDRAESESGLFKTGTIRLHWPIDDPANADGTADSEPVFRRTRQALRDRFAALVSVAETLSDRRRVALQPGISTCCFRTDESVSRSPAFRPVEHIPMLKQAGLSVIELCAYFGKEGEDDFPFMDARAVDELRRIKNDNGISIWSVHSPELHLKSDTEDLVPKLDVLKHCIDVCMELESRNIVIHFFPQMGDDYSQGLPDVLGELDAWVRDIPVTVLLETLQNRTLNQKLLTLLDDLNPSSFGTVMDAGHDHVAGDLNGMPLLLGRTLKHLHLHDNDGRSDQHLSIGKGIIDWDAVAKDLQKADYEGPLVMEADERPGSSVDLAHFLANARERLDDLASSMRSLIPLGTEEAKHELAGNRRSGTSR